jgi:uncharacterized protein YdbL (DUF1318 family)
MNTRIRFIVLLAGLVLCTLVTPSPGLAQDSPATAKEKASLQQKFEQRYPDVKRYKAQGKVGETSRGLLEAVKEEYLSDAALKRLIDEENRDREALYALIAKDEGIEPSLVARRDARRRFRDAAKGEFLKSDGKWTQK